MGRLIVTQFITLDGVVEDPDGSDGTPFGGWAMQFGLAAVAGDKFSLASILESGVLLLGRRSWEHFSTLWPTRDDEFSQLMNRARKAVVTSRPLPGDTWADSTAVAGTVEEWLAETLPSKDVAVIGSGSLLPALAEADAVDEYRLLTFPVAVGSGRRLFDAGARFGLVSAEQSGAAVLSVLDPRG
jgi:dihydrofolate reductase